MRIERAPSLAEQIYERLLRAIVSLEIPPGERIAIEQVAGQLGVSRTPLREALPRLVADGFLEESPSGALRVAPITAQHIREVFQTRAGLEAIAAMLATPSVPESALAAMRDRFMVVESEIARGEFAGHFDADARFHEMVVGNSDNRYLTRMVQGLHNHVARIRAFSQTRPGSQIFASHSEHLELLSALAARDAGRAKGLMEAHILHVGERLSELVL